MRILVYGGCTVNNEVKRDLTALWSKLMTTLNSDCDVMLFDTASTVRPETFIDPGIMIRRWDDNPGHLAHGGGDGAGRTYCAGLEAAQVGKYDYVAICECDMFFTRPVSEVVSRMHKSGVNVACLIMPFYQFMEWGFSVYSVEWLRRTKFVERYDWKHAKPLPIPEQKLEDLCGTDLFILPYHGVRNSQHWLRPDTFNALFPYRPPDWLHENAARDAKLSRMFLAMHGIH